MCGIAGFYHPQQDVDPESEEKKLKQSLASLSHRGPDAQGTKILPSDGAGLGHCRLAILDLDPRSNQPFSSLDQTVHLTYNGEIYNFRELRRDLQKQGVKFRTESDTEVLVEGYRAWGWDPLLERLAGMFAFALFDRVQKRFYLARDRAGKKPLYYALQKGRLVFGSELKALLTLCPSLRELDPDGLDAYLTLKFVPPPHTLLKNVFKVPPASYVAVEADLSVRTVVYWSPLTKRPAIPASEPEQLRELEARLSQAVERRLVSDVPICLFLSGGIDSSLIASYVTRSGVKNMRAYSIGYRDLPAFNELDFSRRVAQAFPIEYQEILMEQKQALSLLEDDALPLDEPVSDWVWVPLYELSRRAHHDGFKVALLGEGSDELFFGYDSMRKGLSAFRRFDQPWRRRLARALVPALAPVYRAATQGHRRFDEWRRLAEGQLPYLGSSLGFNPTQRHQVAGEKLNARARQPRAEEFLRGLYDQYAAQADARDRVNLICFIEFFSKMSEVLLQRVDRITMLHALEARAPFLDHDLAEWAFALPGPLKMKGGRLKGLLKELALQSLPPEVVTRKKMGFSFPFKEWLRGELGLFVERVFQRSRLLEDGWVNRGFCLQLLREHRSGARDHAPRLWMLFDLCRWYDRWIHP